MKPTFIEPIEQRVMFSTYRLDAEPVNPTPETPHSFITISPLSRLAQRNPADGFASYHFAAPRIVIEFIIWNRNDFRGHETFPQPQPPTGPGTIVPPVQGTTNVAQGSIAALQPLRPTEIAPVAKQRSNHDSVQQVSETELIDSRATVTQSAAAEQELAAPTRAVQTKFIGVQVLGDMVAATSQLAANAAVPVVADAVASQVSMVKSLSQPVKRVIEIARLGSPFAFISDAIGSFTEQSAAVPAAQSAIQRVQAKFVTAAVVVADVALLTFMHRRRIKLAKSKKQFENPYLVMH